MKSGLDKILVSYKQAYFNKKLARFFQQTVSAVEFKTDKENATLRAIISEVRRRGDKAVSEFTKKFDGVKLAPENFQISQGELEKAHRGIDRKLLSSIRRAIRNVRKYQREIFVGKNKKCGGGTGVKYTPIKRIGICVPGASAPLPSTVIMTAVPAQVAGVKEIAVISPPRYKGSIHPVISAVCRELGITEVYRIGGAQGVAALAAGTKTIRKVDKIVGPGNRWVQAAKKEVFGFVDIDSAAGQSEVLIIADERANPAWVAADMLSQAEHNPGSAAVFTDSKNFAEKVLDKLKEQAKELGRGKDTVECLKRFGGIFIFKDMDRIISSANEFAPEHLEIQCGGKSREIAKKIENAGAIFIGDYSPVAAGDYWAGPSHTLPTGMTAKFFSALSANDFVKATSIIEYDKNKLTAGASDIIRLSEAEGLDAHAKSVKMRVRN